MIFLKSKTPQLTILARALVQQTPCLVLDEPTNHLNIKFQMEIMDIVKELGCTALCALHDLNLAAQYCDRIYVLNHGRIVKEGTPEGVITEDLLQDVFGVKASIDYNTEIGRINFVYHPRHLS